MLVGVFTVKGGGVAVSLRCYECGRRIEEDQVLMKEVVSSYVLGVLPSTTREPFHSKCYNSFHRKERKEIWKRVLIAWSPILAILLIFFFVWLYALALTL